jgi:hypothetical protein
LRTASRLDEIDRAARQSLKRLFQFEIGVERDGVGMLAIEFDQKVDIAASGSKSPSAAGFAPKWENRLISYRDTRAARR